VSPLIGSMALLRQSSRRILGMRSPGCRRCRLPLALSAERTTVTGLMSLKLALDQSNLEVASSFFKSSLNLLQSPERKMGYSNNDYTYCYNEE